MNMTINKNWRSSGSRRFFCEERLHELRWHNFTMKIWSFARKCAKKGTSEEVPKKKIPKFPNGFWNRTKSAVNQHSPLTNEVQQLGFFTIIFGF
jgi:hypothetical protein